MSRDELIAAVFAARKALGECPSSPEVSAAMHGLIDVEAALLRLREEWFVCGHPAWPDPLPAGDNLAAALHTLRFARSGTVNTDKGWLLCQLRGGRREYRDAELDALLVQP